MKRPIVKQHENILFDIILYYTTFTNRTACVGTTLALLFKY